MQEKLENVFLVALDLPKLQTVGHELQSVYVHHMHHIYSGLLYHQPMSYVYIPCGPSMLYSRITPQKTKLV